MRPRLAVLVDEGFLHHSGVRHYVFDFVAVLRARYDVDFLWHDGLSNRPPTYDIIDFDARYVANYGFLHDEVVGPTRADVLRAVPHPPRRQAADLNLIRRRHGRRLDASRYAGALIYGPWCMDRLPALPDDVPVVMLNHDVIANEFALVQRSGPFEWAAAHTRGILRAQDEAAAILAISEASAASLHALFPSSTPVLVLPAFLAPHYRDAPLASDVTTDAPRSLALVGPLDPRKGLKYVPQVVRRLRNLDSIMVIGESRVPPEDATAFFAGLGVENVTWLRSCRESTREQVLRDSSLLLFPSDDEGLGIPLLEAQVLGLPVAVKDKAPMNQLQLGGCLLSGAVDDDTERLEALLGDLPPRAALAAEARELWTGPGTYAAMRELMSGALGG